MTSDHTDFAKEIAVAIEAYLTLHPNAGDTLDNVARWWLGDGSSASRRLVSEALDLLIARQVVEKRRTEGGAVLYVRSAQERS